MEYTLKCGKAVIIRKPRVEDAENIISVISTADSQTMFLARNPGEFNPTIEEEKVIIEGVLKSSDRAFFVVEYEGKMVGMCSVSLVRSYQRYRHRAEAAFILLESFCNLGIGGKMMEQCIQWCVENKVTQIELDAVTSNKRALNMYQNFGFQIVGTIPNALKYLDGTYANEYKMVKYL